MLLISWVSQETVETFAFSKLTLFSIGRTALHTVFVNMNYVPDMQYIRSTKERVQNSQKKIEAEKKQAKVVEDFVSKYGTDTTRSWFSDGKQIELEKKMKKAVKPEDDKKVELASDEDLLLFEHAEWEDPTQNQVMKSDRVDIFGFLLHYSKISLDQADILGRTPLHYAARVGAFTCTTQLLEKNINLNALDKDKVRTCSLHVPAT
jgi:ankyrin repeat protein